MEIDDAKHIKNWRHCIICIVG